MARVETELLGDLLKAVSRSFYLTLRALPQAVRPQIGLAYLLARATDTIADTEIIPVSDRLQALQSLRDRILGTSSVPLQFHQLASKQNNAVEQTLLERSEEALTVLRSFPIADQKLIQQVLDIITSGQVLDLERFAGASERQIIALSTEAELDDYTYRVAGCVGEFWTRICRAHVFPQAKLDDAWLLTHGIRFGQGLQLVNILRDLPADLRQGRCYLPMEALVKTGLQPSDLLDFKNYEMLRPLYKQQLDRAEAHLRAGWDYTNALPWTSARVRLACAWPLLIGIQTIARLRATNVLDASQRVKVDRSRIKKIMAWSIVAYPFGWLWRRQFPSLRAFNG